MEYTKLLAGRRSTRHFDPSREVPDELLERVLAAPLAMPHAGVDGRQHAGLGATVTGCRPGDLARALDLPEGVVLCPYGVLALGWPAVAGDGAASAAAPKPAAGEMYFSERWGGPSPTLVR